MAKEANRRLGHPFGPALTLSLGLHVAAAVALYVIGLQGSTRPPRPQHLLTTRLVRLGPPRKPQLLPTLAPATAVAHRSPTPALPPAAKPAAPAALSVAEVEAGAGAPPARARANTRSALDRLRREVAGAATGSTMGDTDVAAEGDRYASEVNQCLHQNWVIEGMDVQRVAGLHALVLIRIGPGGTLIDHRILQSSGQPSVDNAVSRAVRRCGRVSPPPLAWRERLRRDGMEIDFSP